MIFYPVSLIENQVVDHIFAKKLFIYHDSVIVCDNNWLGSESVWQSVILAYFGIQIYTIGTMVQNDFNIWGEPLKFIEPVRQS